MRARSTATTVLGLTALVLAGTGCQDPASPSDGPLGPASVSAGRFLAEVPFRLDGGAVLVSQDFAPGFPGGRSDFEGRCSVPSDFVIRFVVTAEATHLGHLTADYEHCSRIDFATGAVTVADGVAVLTSSDGDQLWAVYRTADAPMGAFNEMLRFDGGTGRFASASGHALASVVCDRAAGTCTYQARGTLSYDASSRGSD